MEAQEKKLSEKSSATIAWLIPGIMMEKEYRFYKKQQALVNV